MPEGRSWDEVIDELTERVEKSSSADELDAANAALEEAKLRRDEEARTPMGPPMVAVGPNDDPKDWPLGRIVLDGRDHGKDAVELRARHIERGAMIDAYQTLLRLQVVAVEFMSRWKPDEDSSVRLVTELQTGVAFVRDAIEELRTLHVGEAAVTMESASRNLFGVAKAALGPLSGEAAAAKEALRSVSVQARRSVAQLRMALSMRELTHEEAQMLHETTALDVAAMLQAHASEGMRFVYGEGVWSVHGVPGTVIHADEFGSALAQALTRLRRA
jgi:hypothetical protein